MTLLRDTFDRVCQPESHWYVRVAAAAGLGLVVAMFTVWKFGQAYSVFETAATFVLSTAITTVLGLLLVRADTVRHRVHAGQPVGVLSRLFFGAGIRSLFAWLIVLLIVGFPLAIWLGTMTSSMPAG